MKKRKPKISDKKLRGEWAEMVFMTRATELGLPVSKPRGEMRSYDFVIGRPGHFRGGTSQIHDRRSRNRLRMHCARRPPMLSPRFLRLSCRLCCSRERLVHHPRGRHSGSGKRFALPEVGQG